MRTAAQAERFVVRGSRESRVVRPRASGSTPLFMSYNSQPICQLTALLLRLSHTVYVSERLFNAFGAAQVDTW